MLHNVTCRGAEQAARCEAEGPEYIDHITVECSTPQGIAAMTSCGRQHEPPNPELSAETKAAHEAMIQGPAPSTGRFMPEELNRC